MRPITTVRAGMFTPSASVSVAKTTSISPRAKSRDLHELLQDRQQARVVEPIPCGQGGNRLDLLQLTVLIPHARKHGVDRLLDQVSPGAGVTRLGASPPGACECLGSLPG